MVSRWFGMSRTVKKLWQGTEPNEVRGLAIWNFLNPVEADFGRLGDLGRRSFIADLFCLYLRFFPLADALNSLEGTARIKRRSHVLLALEVFPNNLHCFFLLCGKTACKPCRCRSSNWKLQPEKKAAFTDEKLIRKTSSSSNPSMKLFPDAVRAYTLYIWCKLCPWCVTQWKQCSCTVAPAMIEHSDLDKSKLHCEAWFWAWIVPHLQILCWNI